MLEKLIETQRRLEVLALVRRNPDLGQIEKLAGEVDVAFAEAVAHESQSIGNEGVTEAIYRGLKASGKLRPETQNTLSTD